AAYHLGADRSADHRRRGPVLDDQRPGGSARAVALRGADLVAGDQQHAGQPVAGRLGAGGPGRGGAAALGPSPAAPGRERPLVRPARALTAAVTVSFLLAGCSTNGPTEEAAPPAGTDAARTAT